jgi:hypothetical protein
MIPVSKLAAQGDVLFRRIDQLPAGVVERPTVVPIVVAHSETGHHHAIGDAGVRLFHKPLRDPMVSYLVVEGPFADVVHHRPSDTHETLRLAPGIWEVRRQREWTPEGWRIVED